MRPIFITLLLACAVGAPAADSPIVGDAQKLLADGKIAQARQLIEPWVVDHPEDQAARQVLLQVRVRMLEGEVRSLLSEQAQTKELIVGSPDYEDAKARAKKDVARRLDVVEYFLNQKDYPRAIDGCNAILRDYPGEPAPLCLKFRILEQVVMRERAELEKYKEFRHAGGINDVVAAAHQPPDKARIARTMWIFDEDIAEAERQKVKARLQEKLTLNYEATKVGEVVKALFAVAGVNYLILDSALSEETVTIHLVDETVENALAALARMVKVRYNYSGGTVYVGAEDAEVLTTEIIRLQAGLTDISLQPQITSISNNGPSSSGGGQTGAPGQPARPPAQAPAQGGQQGGEKSDLERFLDKIPDLVVGWPADGKWYLDKKSNSLYVRATPWAIAEVKRLLAAIDYNSVQVLIEARFCEVSETAARDLGIDWSGQGKIGTTSIGGPGASLISGAAGGSAVVQTSDAAAKLSGKALENSGFFAQVLMAPRNFFSIQAAIVALEREGKADTLSEPKILTMNNAMGLIDLTREVPYIDNYQTQSYTTSAQQNSSSTVTANNVVATPTWGKVNVGIVFRINPSIARNSDVITLRLWPEVTEVIDFVPSDFEYQPSAGSANIVKKIQKPITSTRKVETILHIKNGQTIALGGLLQEKYAEDTAGLPFASRIPVLGQLFRRDSKSTERRNLMILVTAHIIDPTGAKLSDEILRLRDTAKVILPEEARSELEKRDGTSATAAAAIEAAAPRIPAPRPLNAGGPSGKAGR